MEGYLPFWSQLMLAQPFVGQRSTNDIETTMPTTGNGNYKTRQEISTRRGRDARLETINMSISGRDLQEIDHPSRTKAKAKSRGKAESIR
jgi:hypothetical protein